MSDTVKQFDELLFFSQVKKRPGLYLGKPSLLSLRDQLFGMEYAFSFFCREEQLRYFYAFTKWYQENVLKDMSDYACWWNHILYTTGNDDGRAFEAFFIRFEQYLTEIHGIQLPEVI